jgi:hypothetical protein
MGDWWSEETGKKGKGKKEESYTSKDSRRFWKLNYGTKKYELTTIPNSKKMQ